MRQSYDNACGGVSDLRSGFDAFLPESDKAMKVIK